MEKLDIIPIFVVFLLNNKLKTAIKNIANIKTGLFAKPISEGEVVYLQAKHFNEFGQLNSGLHPDLRLNDISEKHLLRHGDILFAAKGTKNITAMYENKNGPAVASTSFFVIRLQKNCLNEVLPEFLVWFFNHPDTQKFLKRNAIGTSMASISKAVLEELEISIPDLQTQKAILEIMNLRNTEKKLKLKIETLREKLIQQQVIISIK